MSNYIVERRTAKRGGRPTVHLVLDDGREYSLTEIHNRTGLSRPTLLGRIDKGHSFEKVTSGIRVTSGISMDKKPKKPTVTTRIISEILRDFGQPNKRVSACMVDDEIDSDSIINQL